jgi:hypothetical protein
MLRNIWAEGNLSEELGPILDIYVLLFPEGNIAYTYKSAG